MTRASEFSHRALTACITEPRFDTSAPWWDHLPVDFSSMGEPFRLTTPERLQVGFTAASDVALSMLITSLPTGGEISAIVIEIVNSEVRKPE